MTKQITEVRHYAHDDSAPWVVDILDNPRAADGYVQPDGTVGSDYRYDTKKEAEAAEALFHGKNSHIELEVETSAGEKDQYCEDCYLKPDCQAYQHQPASSCPRYMAVAKSPVGTKETNPKDVIRTFETGATRDTAEGKLDYVKALCPLVLRRYVQYLDKHRLQPDGGMRDFDNWKKGIPRETYHSSKGRHFFAGWLLEEGYAVSDNHGVVNEEDALCGELFNTMGKLREVLRAKLASEKKE